MKDKFIGFYNPTEGEIKAAWTKGIFAFDANTLLNLYRYSKQTKNDFLQALETLNTRIFLPHQAALEYHQNRITVIDDIQNSYDIIKKDIDENFKKNLEPSLSKFKKHPAEIIEEIRKFYDKFRAEASDTLDKQKKKHPDLKKNDAVLKQITELFKNSVGIEYDNQKLDAIYLEGEKRYNDQIPPGFKDQKEKEKKGKRHVYGDLIIWKQLIDFCKVKQEPFIFVTDDRKEDWWTIEKGKIIRPRAELIQEFYELTGTRILIYSSDHFLSYAKEKNLVPGIKEKSIEEVKEIRRSDESTNRRISELLDTDRFNYLNSLHRDLQESNLAVAMRSAVGNQTLGDLLGSARNTPILDLYEANRQFSESIIPDPYNHPERFINPSGQQQDEETLDNESKKQPKSNNSVKTSDDQENLNETKRKR